MLAVLGTMISVVRKLRLQTLEERLNVVALYKWYCNFWVDADVESSLELLPLWRQLLVSLQSVKLAKHPGASVVTGWMARNVEHVDACSNQYHT